MSTADEGPPGREQRPGQRIQSADVRRAADSSVTRKAGVDRLARRRLFALHVVSERADGRIVSQVYVSLPAAERKVATTYARGLAASMTLVRLTPVPVSCDADLAVVDGGAA